MAAFRHRDSDRKKTMSKTTGWLPPADSTDMAMELSVLKVHKLTLHPGTTDALTLLKESWIGRIYRGHLKKIPLVRNSTMEIWRYAFPVFVRLKSTSFLFTARNWRPIVKLADYVEESNTTPIEVFGRTKVDTPPPKVSPIEDQALLISPHNSYEFPPIYIAEICDAEINGGTNLVFVHDAVICHDLYDFKRDYTSEELHGHHILDRKKTRLHRVKIDTKPEEMPMAAVFLDACASNYAHWLTEVLPRIATFCSVEKYVDVPLIVDDGLHQNIMESLALVVGKDREIITLPIGRTIKVDTLCVTSVTGYVPFERRNTSLTGHSHGLFSPSALDLLRKRVLPATKDTSTQDWPKKIYLRRNSGPRQITNDLEIEGILTSNGYVALEPEKLTFLQQLSLFQNVEEFVGPSGAALANQVFAPVEANAHILIGKYDVTSYWYWQNQALAKGSSIKYVLGKISTKKDIHSNFRVNSKDLLTSITRNDSQTLEGFNNDS